MAVFVNIFSVLIVLIGIIFTIFVNYPEPPLSPLLYQWQSSGKTFIFKGYQIFYKDEITVGINNITILCLHGFPTSSFDWYKTWADLRRNVRRIIAPDFLGFGFSDKPRFHSYSIKEQSDLIQELLSHMKVEKVHILGHDYGDSVTQELMARQNEGKLSFTIESVCLLNGGIFPTKHKPRIMQKMLRTPIIGTILSKLANYYMFKVSMTEVFGINTQPTIDEFHDMWKLIRHNNGYRVWGDILSYIDERFENEERWVSALRTQKIALHFIYGPSDPVNPPPFETTYKEIVPNASIDVLQNDISHYPQLETPKLFLQLYFNWLKKNSFIKQVVFNT